jgi:hypothetical protein
MISSIFIFFISPFDLKWFSLQNIFKNQLRIGSGPQGEKDAGGVRYPCVSAANRSDLFVRFRKNQGGLADFHHKGNPTGEGDRDKICKSKGRH